MKFDHISRKHSRQCFTVDNLELAKSNVAQLITGTKENDFPEIQTSKNNVVNIQPSSPAVSLANDHFTRALNIHNKVKMISLPEFPHLKLDNLQKRLEWDDQHVEARRQLQFNDLTPRSVEILKKYR